MSNSILYINGRYLCQWSEFEEIIRMLLDSNIMDKTQDDIFASLRDGIVYDWMLERNILNADNLHPKHFINTTDSTVKQYLMRLFGNREEVVKSLDIGEYIELNHSFSIEESNGVVTEGTFNGISKIYENTECLIHIKFRVIKAANEEFSINVIGKGNETPIMLDNFKISTRTKASFVSYELNVKNLFKYKKVAFLVDGNEILAFRRLHNNWLESETKLLPKRPRQITIICDRNDVRLVIPKYGNEILKKGENTISFVDRPTLIKGFGFDGNKSGIRQILLSDIDTSQCITMHEMFVDCNNITQLFMGRFNTSKVLNLSGMFQNCKSLKTLDLSTFDTSKVTDMSFMFCGCRDLSSVNVISFDTSNVSYMHRMFYNCSSLTSIELRGFNTSHVTDMSGMFSNCALLSSLNLAGFRTINVTNMSEMFKNCSSIQDLELSNFDTTNVIGLSETFLGCSNLVSLNISGWVIKSAYNIFSGCEKLRFIHAIGCSVQTVNKIKQQLNYAGLSSVQIITERPSIVNVQEKTKGEDPNPNLSKPNLIDMGTSVLWRSCNLGADRGFEDGDYFSWGALHNSECFGKEILGYRQVTKRNLTGLQELDAARFLLGEGYRIPTVKEWEELMAICEYKSRIITIKGRKYVKLISTKTNNQLLLPIIGHIESDICNNDYAQYWTSEQATGKSAYISQVHDSSWELTSAPKWCGLPIRPVFDSQTLSVNENIVTHQNESQIVTQIVQNTAREYFDKRRTEIIPNNKTYPAKKDINESNVYNTLIKDFLPNGKYVFEGDIMHDIDLNVVKLNEILTTNYGVGPISKVAINNLTFKQFKKYLVQLLSK